MNWWGKKLLEKISENSWSAEFSWILAIIVQKDSKKGMLTKFGVCVKRNALLFICLEITNHQRLAQKTEKN